MVNPRQKVFPPQRTITKEILLKECETIEQNQDIDPKFKDLVDNYNKLISGLTEKEFKSQVEEQGDQRVKFEFLSQFKQKGMDKQTKVKSCGLELRLGTSSNVLNKRKKANKLIQGVEQANIYCPGPLRDVMQDEIRKATLKTNKKFKATDSKGNPLKGDALKMELMRIGVPVNKAGFHAEVEMFDFESRAFDPEGKKFFPCRLSIRAKAKGNKNPCKKLDENTLACLIKGRKITLLRKRQ